MSATYQNQDYNGEYAPGHDFSPKLENLDFFVVPSLFEQINSFPQPNTSKISKKSNPHKFPFPSPLFIHIFNPKDSTPTKDKLYTLNTKRSQRLKIITFVSRKGGVGKSSLTCLLALYWAKKGKSAAIKDYDAQGSSSAFVDLMADPNIATYTGGEDFDYLLIDTPGGINRKDLNELVELSDLVIVPLCLSPTDIRASTETAKLILSPVASAKEDTEPAKSRLLFNQVNFQTSAFKDRAGYAKAIGLKPLKNYLSKRVGYSYALIDGWRALNRKCVDELDKLAKEISR